MATVLIIEDNCQENDPLAQLIESIEDHLTVERFEDPEGALAWLRWHAADLILTDFDLSRVDGVDLVRRTRQLPSCEDVPLLILATPEKRDQLGPALDAGATDFLIRPFDNFECYARCRNLLTQQWQRKIIHDRAKWLERRVAEATSEIRIREHETLLRLAKAGEYRDEDTGNHIIRMAKYSRLIAEQMSLSEEECEIIELAAPMHDIGKIGIPDHILLKRGELTSIEFNIMKTHTQIGFEILKDSPSDYLQMGAVIALGHHERYDGTGYPNNLRGDEIPLHARVVAVADAYDALTSKRPYKQPWSADRAIEYVQYHRGLQFDPQCVDAFCSQMEKILKIQYVLSDQMKSRQKSG